jgi:spore coat protein U-like protein
VKCAVVAFAWLTLGVPRPAAAISCSWSSSSAVSFGSYDVFDGAPVDAAGTVSFICDLILPIETVMVTLSAGGAGSYSPRTLTSGASSLAYNLYRDAARTVVWGDGTGGTSVYGPATAPLATLVPLTVYGRVPARQDVRAGAYGDTVVATLHF